MGRFITPDQANYERGEYRPETLPVKSFKPNPWGLYQVRGNVSEWVEDCWNENYKGAPSDGSAWTTGSCSAHLLRGGSLLSASENLRAAYRGVNSSASFRTVDGGFRVARALKP